MSESFFFERAVGMNAVLCCAFDLCRLAFLQIKNSAESENLTWILANTKPCPKCT
jgi:hypothetical protein